MFLIANDLKKEKEIALEKYTAFTFANRQYSLKIIKLNYIPLTNRVQGPYCKLRPAFFPIDLWPKRNARGP